jgi:hypothetical protein
MLWSDIRPAYPPVAKKRMVCHQGAIQTVSWPKQEAILPRLPQGLTAFPEFKDEP